MSFIASASTQTSSIVVHYPLETVWADVRTLAFGWKAIKDIKGNVNEVGGTRTVSFKDTTIQTWKLLELSDLDHFVTWEIVDSEPSIAIMAASNTIKLRRVTHDNSTFIEWSTYLPSADTTANALEDAKFKKAEAFEDLVAHLSAKK
ncbi:hypothetical protein SmJEL517_g00563 [Synchytrium microbalum]|uniref:Bet v I/Major latex protein domain-containing protein n=1 Tax=Synchytrium microbalum TaxID=1806994 RepID=A0A507CHC9_9FUNG|nr:uncharacterized protein SmJEL517_g00563 [Synchytrium microbalum]TPX37476.1 hypothetical protein SmJEL517_g00563 [Synchytrium microbalum]